MKTRTTLPFWGLLCLLFTNFIIANPGNDDFAGIHCPGDKFASCDDELWDLSGFGNAEYVDYSGTHDAGEPTVKYYLNSCGQGHIKRTWKVKIYNQWHSCTQYIYVEGSESEVHINWPKNLTLDGCNPITDPKKIADGSPTWNASECSMLASSHRDTYYNFGSSSCNTILREWTVMDWCTYDKYRNPYKGIYKHTQTIKIVNDDIPALECPQDVTISSYNCSGGYVTIPEIVVDAASCGGEYSVKNDSPYAQSSGKNISGEYPIGTTQVTYSVTYGCGHRISCKVNVTVKNNKAPTPYCRGDLTVALMGIDTDGDRRNDVGMVEVWAKDLDLGSEGVCGNQELFFSFSEDINDDVRIFTCDDVGKNDVALYVTDKLGNQDYCTVKVSIQNNAANIINCSPEIEVVEEENETENEIDEDNNLFQIDSSLFIAGSIADQFGNAVDGMEFEIRDLDGKPEINFSLDTIIDIRLDSIWTDGSYWDYQLIIDTIELIVSDTIYREDFKMAVSDDSGTFKVENYFEKNNNYMISGYEGGEVGYKIPQVLDLRILYDHVTGRAHFTSHFQYLAADLNGDGKINFSDVNEMINVLVSNRATYSAAKAFRMMKIYPDLPLNESILKLGDLSYYMLENIETSFEDADFTMVYLGWLSEENVQLNRFKVQARSNELLEISRMTSRVNSDEVSAALDAYFGYTLQPVEDLVTYPNPARENLTIEFNYNKEVEAVLEILDMSGKTILSNKKIIYNGFNKFDVNLSGIPDGIYLSRISTETNSFSNRVVINR